MAIGKRMATDAAEKPFKQCAMRSLFKMVMRVRKLMIFEKFLAY